MIGERKTEKSKLETLIRRIKLKQMRYRSKNERTSETEVAMAPEKTVMVTNDKSEPNLNDNDKGDDIKARQLGNSREENLKA
ncbi:hypothetical protein V6N11_052721 [Hibiscus sabdariffa]|uniref:Uncharacterized protein n=1 Tax=Hibiscus sabdariffa TaxID=183260 RepID=A0ABR2UAV9_9ROSI